MRTLAVRLAVLAARGLTRAQFPLGSAPTADVRMDGNGSSRSSHARGAGGGDRRVSARAGVEEEKEMVVVVVFALPGDGKHLQHLQTAPASPFHRQARRMHGRSGCQLLLRLPGTARTPRTPSSLHAETRSARNRHGCNARRLR